MQNTSQLVLYITDRIKIDCLLNNRMVSMREPHRRTLRPEAVFNLTGSAEISTLEIVIRRARYRLSSGYSAAPRLITALLKSIKRASPGIETSRQTADAAHQDQGGKTMLPVSEMPLRPLIITGYAARLHPRKRLPALAHLLVVLLMALVPLSGLTASPTAQECLDSWKGHTLSEACDCWSLLPDKTLEIGATTKKVEFNYAIQIVENGAYIPGEEYGYFDYSKNVYIKTGTQQGTYQKINVTYACKVILTIENGLITTNSYSGDDKAL